MANAVTKSLQEEQSEPFINELNQRADKILQYALSGYFICGLFLATYHSTWLVAFGVGALCLLGYWTPKILLPHRSLHRYLGSAALAVFTAQFVYQMHGLFEMHFFVFVGCTLLAIYQNWKLQLPLIVVVIVYQITFAYLQHTGTKDIYFTQLDSIDLQTFLLHVGLTGLTVCICGAWAFQLRQKTGQWGHQAQLYQKQAANIDSNIRFAEEISRGNLNVEFELHENDALSRALLEMRQSLLVANEREQQEKFKTIGLAEIGEILRATHNLHELAEKVIVKLVKYMKANQGGLFIVQKENQEQPCLELAACYAFDRRKHLQKNFQVGEGLVGQAMLEKDVIYLTEVPQNYIQIKSGLGGSNPRSVLIVPLVVNDTIEGVIELASFNAFQPFEIEFMQKLGESIASTIASVKINERTKDLLEESQIQAEQMRAQEEEMRQNMEELAATQEEMQRKSTEMERLMDETQEQTRQLANNEKRMLAILNSVAAAIIQTDINGNIQSINEIGQEMFGYGKGGLYGIAIDTVLVPSEETTHYDGDRSNKTAHRSDGSTFVAAVSSKKLTTDEGTFFLYFVWDVDAGVQREREMQRKQEEIEVLLRQAQENEEILKVQEEVLRQNLEEMTATQEALKEKAEEIERIRVEDKNRADTLVNSQKKIIEKVIQKQQEKEKQLTAQVETLQQELEKYRPK